MRDTSGNNIDRTRGGSRGAPVFGLALGGGAILGLAHVGVLEALESAGLSADLVTGTSIGALVGACYAGGMSIADMKSVSMNFSWKNVRKRKVLPTMAVYSSEPMKQWLEDTLPCRNFDDLKLPLGCVATDLRTSQMVVLGGRYLEGITGDDDDIMTLETGMVEAIRASCTVPVLFEPVQVEGRTLVDGFLTNNVPAGIARMMGAQFVVAVDLQQRRTLYTDPSNIFEYTMQSQIIYRYWAVRNRRIWADVVLRPDLKGLGWDDTDKADVIIAAGREAALEKIEEIKAGFESARLAAAELLVDAQSEVRGEAASRIAAGG